MRSLIPMGGGTGHRLGGGTGYGRGRARTRALALLAVWAAVLAALPAQAAPNGTEGPGQGWRLGGVRLTVAEDRFRKDDDAGFTSFQSVEAQFSRGADERFGLTVANQMITERGGRRRVDEGTVVGERGRRRVLASGLEVELALQGGLSVQSDLGGARLQDLFHALVGGGRLDEGLQDRYPDSAGIAVLAGGRVGARWQGRGPLAIAAGAGGRLALGGGVSDLRGSLGIVLGAEHVRAEAGAEVVRYFCRDPFLTMPGGYVTGAFHASPFLRVAALRRGLEIELEARANVGGSGQGLSQISVRLPLR